MLSWTYNTILIFGIVILSFAECTKITTGKRDCKLSVLGREYRGKLNVTRSGRQCQSWSMNTPHKHRFSKALRTSENYCRNPDLESEGPWCYTTDKSVRWEYCDIPKCGLTDATCYEEGFSAYYSGNVNITESGRPCSRWDSDEFYQDFSEIENYCRDVDGAGFPWCLSSAPGMRWERCNVDVCNELGCPDGWTQSLQLNHCYIVDRQSVNWTEAVEGCRMKLSNLTSIDNHEEKLFVAALIADDSKSKFWTGMVKSNTNESKLLDSAHIDSRLNSSNHFKYSSITVNPDTKEIIWFTNIGNEKLQGSVCKRNLTGVRRHFRRYCDKYFEEKCYSTHTTKVDFMSAERYCQEKYGGHLASIKNWLNNIFLTDDLPIANDGFWIGAISSLMNNNNSVAKWTNGERYQYSNWTDATKRSLLDPKNVHSYYMFLTLNGSWEAAPNTSRRGFICETKWDEQKTGLGNIPSNFHYHDAVHWCKNGWRPFGEKCYMVLKEKRNWADGRRTCHSEGGSLLSPNRTSEVLFLRSILTDINAQEAWIENMPLKINNKMNSGGSYHVTHSRNLTTTEGNDCMALTSNGTLRRRNCTDMKLTICEMRSNGCGEAPEIPNAQHPIRGSFYPAGTSLVYKCDSGYISGNNQVLVQCAVNLTWIGPKNRCHENCYRPGEPYYGNFSKTVSGKICQSWSFHFPHIHKYSHWPNAWENYCRDYEHDQPWCYTTDTDTKWENCNVLKCADVTTGLISTTEIQTTIFSKPEHTSQTPQSRIRDTTESPFVKRHLPGYLNSSHGNQDNLPSKHNRNTTDLVISVLTLISVFVILVFAVCIIYHLRRKQQSNVPVEQTPPSANGDVIYMVENSDTQYTSSTDLRPIMESSW